MSQGAIHIIGAGLAGLSAATRLAEAGRRVIVYEATAQAGGRCRSYHDAAFGGVIDNGNHLLLSGNKTALAYLRRISAEVPTGTGTPEFAFIDVKTGAQWTIHAEYKTLLHWLLNKHYRRVLHTILLSALNTNPHDASKKLISALLCGTLLKGGSACIPLIAEGLSAVFIDPALRYLATHHGSILFQRRLRHIVFENGIAVSLDFGEADPVTLGKDDIVVCSVPPWIAAPLLPGVNAPDEYRAILNAHFRIAVPDHVPRILGVVGGTIEWIFAFPDRISITISDADRLMQEDRETLAQRLWAEIAALIGLASTLPPWQIVKEKRATFAATPKQNAKRPSTPTPWRNVYLAGDWVQTGLPATIEGAVLSGEKAAAMILEK